MVNSGSLGVRGASTPDWRLPSGQRGGCGGGSLSPAHKLQLKCNTVAYRHLLPYRRRARPSMHLCNRWTSGFRSWQGCPQLTNFARRGSLAATLPLADHDAEAQPPSVLRDTHWRGRRRLDGPPGGRQVAFFAFCARSPTTASCVSSDLANLMLTDAPRRISISGKPASAVSGKRKQRQRTHTLVSWVACRA